MFIGRERELTTLKEQFVSPARTAVLVYGKRRVGKSTLISEAAKGFDGTVVEHLCVQSTYAGNLSLLCRSVSQALGLPPLNFGHLYDLFDFLKSQPQPVLIVIDEYQYFKNSLKGAELDSYFQTIIDSLPPHVKLVLCGSYITIMKELLAEANPLFGRFSAILHVEEFDYLDASRFYHELPVRDKIARYAVFGGSPFVLSSIDPAQSLETNIEKLLLPTTGILRTHIENVMLKEVQRSFDVRILEVIGNGKKRYSEICSALGGDNNGLLDKQLKNLISMETVTKSFPINKQRDKKKHFYEVRDNLMRFYFCYLFGNEALLAKFGENAFFDNRIAPSLVHFVSRRFEAVALQYFMRLARLGRLPGVTDFGSYWYDDPATKTNGEFDCVLSREGGIDCYECKYYESPMSLAECRDEETQVRAIPGVRVGKVGFICTAGFEFDAAQADYELVTGEDLFRVGP